MFLKKESDKLVPYCKYDYKIELIVNNNLGYSPLRKHIEEELYTIKKYITENLDKGFISISTALFVALILFAQKGDRTLRFYVDYRKLNLITKKDRYPLPLLKETLSRLSRAKRFTKIDI